jgi:peptidoglycan/LPS O-acetylase OafA/YrhL
MATTLTEPTTRPSAKAIDRNLAIDSLRGIAALAVLGFHVRPLLWIGTTAWVQSGSMKWYNPDTILGLASTPFRWGNWGVPLFFVISGYCIHRPYARKRDLRDFRFDLNLYFLRRLWRIYPPLLAALLLTAGLDSLARAANPASAELGDNSLACFVANLLTLQNITAPVYGSNVPLWTLSIEIHFYLLYPLLYLAIKRFGLLPPMLAVFTVSVGSWLAFERAGWQSSGFFMPYWFSWALGAYIAEAEAGRAAFPARLLVPAAVPCLVLAVAVERWKGSLPDSRPVVFLLLCLPFALLLWYAIQRPAARLWNSRASRLFAFVGLFSYSLYATHMPTLVAYQTLIQGGDQARLFVAVIPGIAVALIVAYAMYLLVEQWCLRPPSMFYKLPRITFATMTWRRRLLLLACLAAVTGLAIAVYLRCPISIFFKLGPRPTPPTEIFQGVTYTCEELDEDECKGLVLVVRVDLTAPGVGIYLTPLDPEAVRHGYQYRLTDPATVLRKEDLAVVINATFFSADSTLFYKSGDLARGVQTVIVDGKVSHVDPHSYMLWFEPDLTPHIENSKPPTEAVLRRARWGIGGGGVPVWHGQALIHGANHQMDSRTAVGIDSQRRLLWLAVFENASEGAVPQVLVRHGVQEGFLLDGGHSTTMVIGPGAAGVTSGTFFGGVRPVATCLGIKAQRISTANHHE